MILGLATRDNNIPLKTRKAAEGLYVVLNAYEGRYEYFAAEETKSDETTSGVGEVLQSHDQIDRLSGLKKQEE